jgi:primosomal protein N' (replication factor Y)
MRARESIKETPNTGAPVKGVFASVVVGLNLERRFDYLIPASLQGVLRPGFRVLVPFGHRNMTGYVLALSDTSDHPGPHREITSTLDTRPSFSPSMLDFLKWAAAYYQVPVGRMLERAIPSELKVEGKGAFEPDKTVRMVRLRAGGVGEGGEPGTEARPGTEAGKTPGTEALPGKVPGRLLERLREAGGACTWSELRELGAQPKHLNLLLERGLVEEYEERVFREALCPEGLGSVGAGHHVLNDQQEAARKAILAAEGFAGFLLHGVTGSGKTEVYLKLVREAVERGRGALVLVPEIALTPQLTATFREGFGDKVAVLHSALGGASRYDQWCLIAEGKRPIVLGARSAIFAPLPDVGLIIVDEEHEPSFKQENTPFYSARDLALLRGKFAGARVVLGSATPSLESYENAGKGKLTLLTLSKRATARPLPEVTLVDMKQRAKADSRRIFSDLLVKAIKRNLEGGGQCILFLNRRGYAPFLLCGRCGYVPRCPDCSVSLTLHGGPRPRLLCHYCNREQEPTITCPECGADELADVGFGLEKAALSLEELFPGLPVGLLDGQSSQGKLLSTLAEFRSGRLACLLGTQVLAKGHDFPGVSLVGVLLADLTLAFPDFRGAERTFQLITQVAGRAGRGERAGEVLVQTYLPQHYSLAAARTHDYQAFAKQELESRRERLWPPYTFLVLLRLSSLDAALLDSAAGRMARTLDAQAARQGVTMLGPTPAPMMKIKGRTRYQIMLRSESRSGLSAFLDRMLPALRQGCPRDVLLEVDVDPVDLM